MKLSFSRTLASSSLPVASWVRDLWGTADGSDYQLSFRPLFKFACYKDKGLGGKWGLGLRQKLAGSWEELKHSASEATG